MKRPRQVAEDHDLEAPSTEQLEALHQGLMRLCSMPAEAQAKVVERLLAGDDVVPTGTAR